MTKMSFATHSFAPVFSRGMYTVMALRQQLETLNRKFSLESTFVDWQFFSCVTCGLETNADKAPLTHQKLKKCLQIHVPVFISEQKCFQHTTEARPPQNPII